MKEELKNQIVKEFYGIPESGNFAVIIVDEKQFGECEKVLTNSFDNVWIDTTTFNSRNIQDIITKLDEMSIDSKITITNDNISVDIVKNENYNRLRVFMISTHKGMSSLRSLILGHLPSNTLLFELNDDKLTRLARR